MKKAELEVLEECRELAVAFCDAISRYKESSKFEYAVYNSIMDTYTTYQSYIGYYFMLNKLSRRVDIDKFREFLDRFKKGYNL